MLRNRDLESEINKHHFVEFQTFASERRKEDSVILRNGWYILDFNHKFKSKNDLVKHNELHYWKVHRIGFHLSCHNSDPISGKPDALQNIEVHAV